jgi:hypothetical protein
MSTTDRQQYREVLAALAQKTEAKIPALNGRISKAMKLVLAGDVALHEDGSATVASLSQPSVTYRLRNGECQCKDYAQAPEHLCSHRLAVGFARKVNALLPPEPQSAPVQDLPEARASLNLRAQIGPFEVQITLRDSHENVLMERLQALLQRSDVRPLPKPAPKTGGWKPRQGR